MVGEELVDAPEANFAEGRRVEVGVDVDKRRGGEDVFDDGVDLGFREQVAVAGDGGSARCGRGSSHVICQFVAFLTQPILPCASRVVQTVEGRRLEDLAQAAWAKTFSGAATSIV